MEMFLCALRHLDGGGVMRVRTISLSLLSLMPPREPGHQAPGTTTPHGAALSVEVPCRDPRDDTSIASKTGSSGDTRGPSLRPRPSRSLLASWCPATAQATQLHGGWHHTA